MSATAELCRSVESAAEAAAALLVQMQARQLQINRKTGLDIVTEADLASERLLLDRLRGLRPGAAILSEEAGLEGAENGNKLWIVDPLDGTINYAAGLPWYSVTVAYQEQGEVRLGVVNTPRLGLRGSYTPDAGSLINGQAAAVSQRKALADSVVSVMLTSSFSPADIDRTVTLISRLARAARGVRTIVSGALELSLVAAGRMDGFVSIRADAVSHAAGMAMVRGAGGKVTTLGGQDATVSDWQKVASNGHIHAELLACLSG